MTPAARQRLIDLPDALRAWAHEDPTARLLLSVHVTARVPLGHALARLSDALGEEGDWEIRRRLTAEMEMELEKFWPWCAALFPDGLRCRGLSTQLVLFDCDGCVSTGCVERCEDCARTMVREGTGRVLRPTTWRPPELPR